MNKSSGTSGAESAYIYEQLNKAYPPALAEVKVCLPAAHRAPARMGRIRRTGDGVMLAGGPVRHDGV